MTRKDFNLIAQVLKQSNAPLELVSNFAQELAKTNPGFDSERFVKACGK